MGVLWPYLLREGIKIHFAHRTFSWMSEAKGKAHVHVVIIGFGLTEEPNKHVFTYEENAEKPIRLNVQRINPYLIDGPEITVKSRAKPICNVPEMVYGNKPTDDGNFLFTTEEKKQFIKLEPKAARFFRPCLGSEEYINGIERWCLWLRGVDPQVIKEIPLVMERVENVRAFRAVSSKQATRESASRAHEFQEIRHTNKPYLLVPRVSSERRDYIPIGFIHGNTISTDANLTIPNATLYEFGILTSKMHMVWMQHVAGRLKSDYRYSAKLVYNNYPWPEVTLEEKEKIIGLAQAVLDARAAYPKSSLAALYDSLVTPTILLKAHQALNRAVDRLYRKKGFASDTERFAHLIERYQLLAEGPIGIEKGKRRRGKNK